MKAQHELPARKVSGKVRGVLEAKVGHGSLGFQFSNPGFES